MFGAFSRLNYKPWFAIAEFVDNSVQSFLSNREAIRTLDGAAAKLIVNVTLEDDRVVVHDNAAGIRVEDFPRAFSPAQRPPDTSGLSEFGLGMKAAACWFARRWSVRTCALGEAVERVVQFDVPQIVANNIEDIAPSETPVPLGRHYTVLLLQDLHQKMRGASISKLKMHLGGIYRSFISDGTLSLLVNGVEVKYSEPPILIAPYYRTPASEPVRWRKDDIDIHLDDQHRVTGWAALRAKASVADAGFSVFRRGRVIIGSADARYRPERIFRRANSYTYQRLFGELHVEGFEVSHTKDGLQWEEWEDDILDELKRQLDAEPLKLLEQAEEHRVRGTTRIEDNEHFGDSAMAHTAEALQQHAGPIVASQLRAEPEPETPPLEVLPPAPVTSRREVTLNVEHDAKRWKLTIELSPDPGTEDWYSFSRRDADEDGLSEAVVRLSMVHPFTERFGLKEDDEIEPLVRIAAGLALAEIAALDVGISKRIKTLRRNFNQLLRHALAK